MDLKGVLNEQDSAPEPEKEQSDKDSAVRVHKKPIQLRDIENRSSSNRKTSLSHESDEKIKKLLVREKKQYYKQQWNKLDNGMKINRIKHFCESEKEKKSLSDKDFEMLKKLLITSCTSGKLNKSSDIVYNKEDGFIESIKILKYSEETKEYKMQYSENKKKTSSSKSKSNIDRFLKTNKK
tara:strand:+ start:2469 stop:3011 length:543 start_codon:yes stop_codon:yes gene_type:complete